MQAHTLFVIVAMLGGQLAIKIQTKGEAFNWYEVAVLQVHAPEALRTVFSGQQTGEVIVALVIWLNPLGQIH